MTEQSSEDTSYASLMLNPNEKSENKVWEYHGGLNMMGLLLAFEFKNLLKML